QHTPKRFAINIFSLFAHFLFATEFPTIATTILKVEMKVTIIEGGRPRRRQNQPRRKIECYFCGENHRVSRCEAVKQYYAQQRQEQQAQQQQAQQQQAQQQQQTQQNHQQAQQQEKQQQQQQRQQQHKRAPSGPPSQVGAPLSALPPAASGSVVGRWKKRKEKKQRQQQQQQQQDKQ
ncbi:hypothetical protein BOX15_Mlig001744g2, partial [Macrostomum lignano]